MSMEKDAINKQEMQKGLVSIDKTFNEYILYIPIMNIL